MQSHMRWDMSLLWGDVAVAQWNIHQLVNGHRSPSAPLWCTPRPTACTKPANPSISIFFHEKYWSYGWGCLKWHCGQSGNILNLVGKYKGSLFRPSMEAFFGPRRSSAFCKVFFLMHQTFGVIFGIYCF